MSTRPTQDDAQAAMDALIETIGLDGLEDVLDPAVAYIHDRHALYGEPPLWGRDTGIAAHSMALAIRAYAKKTATVEHVDAWDVSRMEHETDVLRYRVAALEKENARLRRDAATELTRHDQAHDLYEPGHCTDPDPHPPHEYADDTDLRHCTGTATAPTHTNHKE